MATATARRAADTTRRATRGDWVERAGRVGLVAKAASYALIGVLALQIPLGQGGATADRQGVLRRLATESWGTAALWALAAGFAAYAAWRFVDALTDRRGEGTGASGLAKRARGLGIGAVYVASAVAAVSLVMSSSSNAAGGDERAETAKVLDWPAGRWIVLAVGIGFVADGLYNLYRAATRSFRKRLKEQEMPGPVRPWAIGSGVLGHAARGVVFGLVGIFLAKAAVEYDPAEAVGIDGALLKVAEGDYGTLLLGLVAAGLVAYALYCLVEARYRRI
ncbi:MAG TPA: DUF1206 domain-containing protein [Acidimicrobiales bacterium]|nr:DUF1206 domain-containing protein [Acidimicrobiales bacterium]